MTNDVAAPDAALVRAMAQTLLDRGVNPCDPIRVCVALIGAGFLSRDINECWEACRTMALVRLRREMVAARGRTLQ